MKESFFIDRGIYYRISEIRSGLSTVLFIHGVSGSSSVWLPYEKALEDTHNIISLDLRGHGKSKKRVQFDDYVPEMIASDVGVLIDALSIASCYVVAHSFGTLIALALLRARPQTVSGIVFLSPTYDVASEWWLPIARILCWICKVFGPLFPLSQKPRGHVQYQKLRPTGDWSLRRLIPDVRNTTIRVYAYCLQHIYTRDFNDWWKNVRVPALIVHGKKDTVISFRNAERLARVLSGAELVLLPNANHIFLVNDVEEVKDIIKQFVAKHVR